MDYRNDIRAIHKTNPPRRFGNFTTEERQKIQKMFAMMELIVNSPSKLKVYISGPNTKYRKETKLVYDLLQIPEVKEQSAARQKQSEGIRGILEHEEGESGAYLLKTFESIFFPKARNSVPKPRPGPGIY